MAALIGLDSTSSGFDPGLQDPPITFGVWGDSGDADGVIGSSNAGVGVFGRSIAAGATAVRGSSQDGTGVEATSAGGSALHARRDPGGGAAVTEAFLATPSLAADFRGDVATSGAVRVGGPLGAAGELRARPGGGVELTVVPEAGSPRPVLSVDGAGGDIAIAPQGGHIGIGLGARPAARALHVEGSEVHSGGAEGGFSFADRGTREFVDTPTAGQRWRWYAERGTARLWSGTDKLTIGRGGDATFFGNLSVPGNIGIGLGARPAARALHVEGSEVHSGGSLGGFSFADRSTREFVERPTAGQRWVWYARDTVAVLWSGEDLLYIRPTTGELLARAAHFNGNVHITGTLTKGGSNFEIDHPLDPANKLLQHSGIECDEMKNLYDGVVDLDAGGRAEVVVPDWFEALNENFRYQLTPIGAAAPDLHIAAELREGRFTIAGGQPNTTVCWQLSGVRHDAYAQAHPLQVETLKSPQKAGLFLHPEEHNQPAERSLATLFTAPANDSGQG